MRRHAENLADGDDPGAAHAGVTRCETASAFGISGDGSGGSAAFGVELFPGLPQLAASTVTKPGQNCRHTRILLHVS
jgi:hypothetical protein